MDFISNNSIAALEKGLDYVWQKMNTHNENIANSTTPGYKAKYLSFEDELRASMRGAASKQQLAKVIDNAKVKVNVSEEEALTADGNNVNMDTEYIELARAQIQYEYLVQQVTDQFTRLNTVINGR